MLPRIVRPATATALVASCVLAGTSASARVSAAPTTQPFAGQTISVAYASPPPPKRLLDQFKAQTGITVNWTNVGWDDLQTKITAAAMAHAYLADVTDVDWSRVGQYYRLKWFQPLNTSFNVDSLKRVSLGCGGVGTQAPIHERRRCRLTGTARPPQGSA